MNQRTKYRSDTLRITGLAMLTPFGKIFVDPFSIFQDHDPIYIGIFLITAIALACIGIITITRGHDILK